MSEHFSFWMNFYEKCTKNLAVTPLDTKWLPLSVRRKVVSFVSSTGNTLAGNVLHSLKVAQSSKFYLEVRDEPMRQRHFDLECSRIESHRWSIHLLPLLFALLNHGIRVLLLSRPDHADFDHFNRPFDLHLKENNIYQAKKFGCCSYMLVICNFQASNSKMKYFNNCTYLLRYELRCLPASKFDGEVNSFFLFSSIFVLHKNFNRKIAYKFNTAIGIFFFYKFV